MGRFLDRVRLGYVATVRPDNTPNLSPKGTIFAVDGAHLAFADIRSPGTIENLGKNPSLEINVVDPLSRRGCRFDGTARVLRGGGEFSRILQGCRKRGVRSPIGAVVKARIRSVRGMASPLYDLGMGESEIRRMWKRRYLGD